GKMKSGRIFFHLAVLSGVSVLAALCILYPFLPGEYDRLALGLSTTVQAAGVAGLLFVPTGGLWLVYELQKLSTRKSEPAVQPSRDYFFAFAAVASSLLVAVFASLAAAVSAGFSPGPLTLAACTYLISRAISGLKRLRAQAVKEFNPAPVYMILLPVFATVFQ